MIPAEYKNRYIFHFTHLCNLDSIIKNGLLCTNEKNSQGINHTDIANETIQERRASVNVPVGHNGTVHDYVPFYFSSINPMLLALINQKNVDQNLIIYLCVKIKRLDADDAVFTDASANTNIMPNFYDDPLYLNQLDWDLILSRKWGTRSEEDKHRKMAEALIYHKVGISEIDAIVVYNDGIKKKVQKIFNNNNLQPPAILFDHNDKMREYGFYYTSFFISAKKFETLVTGPLMLKYEFNRLLETIKENRHSRSNTYKYNTVSDLICALEHDISNLKELKDIVGLQQNYPPHYDSVDSHTLKVVSEMKEQEYYKSVSVEQQNLLLLAAYLHDIGKGPKTIWTNDTMCHAYMNHPANAIPMLERILSDEIRDLSDENTRIIGMLVIYHDLISDCIVRHRDIRQIVDVIQNEDDLKMLFAISLADTKAIKNEWFETLHCNKNSLSEKVMIMKHS
jgi:hypothetical protein